MAESAERMQQSLSWTTYRAQMPASKSQWQAYLIEILKDINKHEGTDNCGFCAFQTNSFLAHGFNPESEPVATACAGLQTHTEFHEQSTIIRSFCSDPRLLSQCLSSKSDGAMVDVTGNEVVIDLDADVAGTDNQSKRLKLMKAKPATLRAYLLALPRRNKDGSSYGFIVQTHQTEIVGHITNFFITPENDVFFLDAQRRKPENIVRTELPTEGFAEETFYINSIPPEGFKAVQVKQEVGDNLAALVEPTVQVKREHAELLNQERKCSVKYVNI